MDYIDFHPLYHIDSFDMQNDFIFVDTETKEFSNENDIVLQKFDLGSAIYWHRKQYTSDKEITQLLPFYDIETFWNFVFEKFQEVNERNKVQKYAKRHLILYAHNMEFDFNILKGYEQLLFNGWCLISQYIKASVYILTFQKGNYVLHILSTTNYSPKSLQTISKDIGYEYKMEIDFNTASKEYLMEYCIRDTKIIYNFIKELIAFLIENDLSNLRATAGSMALASFRHRFNDHNQEQQRIDIHSWKKAVELERKSYHGGITDCFQIGSFENAYKTDINSMYPSVMKNNEIPRKLLLWSRNTDKAMALVQDKLLELEITQLQPNSCKDIYNYFKEKEHIGFIVNCNVNIPKDNAYILDDFGLGKTSFIYGDNLNITVCSPELAFIESFGTILEINEIAVYLTSDTLFTDYVDFFYGLREKYKRENNQLYVQFTKLMLNTLYGKFGQKKTICEMMEFDDPYCQKYGALLELMVKSKKELCVQYPIVYLGKIIKDREVYYLQDKFMTIKETENNSKNSLVAISSFITSYARMMLVHYIKIAERKNCYYSDTDSIIVNEQGYENLKQNGCIDEYQLGKLKIEGIGSCNIYAPKFYDFNDERKMKGIRKSSELLQETTKSCKYKVQNWKHTKHNLSTGLIGMQKIEFGLKELSKTYTKGKVLENGFVEPYHISEIVNV